MPTARYSELKKAGLCPGCGLPAREERVYCSECATAQKQYYHDYRINRMLPAQRAVYELQREHKRTHALLQGSTALPLIAHCNQWHQIVSVPFVVPCCGKVVLQSNT